MKPFRYEEESNHVWPRPLEGMNLPELADVRGNGYLISVIGETAGLVSLAMLQPGIAVVCALVAGYGLRRVSMVNQELQARTEE